MRTLIVDDEPSMRRLVAKILSRSGAVCQMAASAEEALIRVVGEPFDIFFIDIWLPGLDGLELARRLQERDPDASLVMMTGQIDTGAVLLAMQAGAADYVVKPFGAEQLERAFGRAVERRRIRLDASRATGLRQAILERTLEMRLLLSDAGGTAQALAGSYLTALELRDGEAAAHASRVAAMSRAMGTLLDIADSDLDLLGHAALLHDIGKAALPVTVLSRPEPLSTADIQLIRRHPEFGFDVVRQVPALAPCAQTLLAQLEYYDGSGTPLGLRGSQIPLPARVIAVANALDVMTHPRPHAAERSVLDAARELESYAGSRFDPDVIAALLKHLGIEPFRDDWALDAEP